MEICKMKEINVDELKKVELETLKKIHSICDAKNIRYSLAGGTLLGAIRHGGFIPWDDDIDIFMPRPDYDKFVEFCANNDVGFEILSSETNDAYGYLFAKAMAKNTVIIEEKANPNNIDLGIYVDVFPIDGLADTYKGALKEFQSSSFQRELLVAKNWKKFFRSKTRSAIYEPIRFAFFLLSRFTRLNKTIQDLQRKFRKNNFDKSVFSACICGAYRKREIAETKIFNEYIDVFFEGIKFKAIKHYDEYLTNIYGDYMKLPPEGKRVSHHMFKAYVSEKTHLSNW